MRRGRQLLGRGEVGGVAAQARARLGQHLPGHGAQVHLIRPIHQAQGAAPDSVTCIHHPSGDIKKISGAWGTFDQQDGVDMGNGPADCWHVPAWGYGTTEPGSSGSGLWNKDHHLIGQLYGGEADCNNSVNDYFGRFDLSYPLLSEWLGECGGTLDGYDPYAIVPMPQDAAITSIMDVGVNLCNVDS